MSVGFLKISNNSIIRPLGLNISNLSLLKTLLKSKDKNCIQKDLRTDPDQSLNQNMIIPINEKTYYKMALQMYGMNLSKNPEKELNWLFLQLLSLQLVILIIQGQRILKTLKTKSLIMKEKRNHWKKRK